MPNLEELNKLIDDSGIKRKTLANKLGVTYATFLRKMKGKSEFTIAQADTMCDALHLDMKQRKQVFF